jgi:hypothetical protein
MKKIIVGALFLVSALGIAAEYRLLGTVSGVFSSAQGEQVCRAVFPQTTWVSCPADVPVPFSCSCYTN